MKVPFSPYDPSTDQKPDQYGLYEVLWHFQGNEHQIHKGTAVWTNYGGGIWVAKNTPGGAIIIAFKKEGH